MNNIFTLMVILGFTNLVVYDKIGMFKSYERSVEPTMIVLHHTGGSTLKSAEDTLVKRGLGYHYIIDKDGKVYLYVQPSRVVYHTKGHNYDTVGISYVGGGKYGIITSTQYKSLVKLMVGIKNEYTTVKTFTGHKYLNSGKIDPSWPENNDDYWMNKLASDTGLKRGGYG